MTLKNVREKNCIFDTRVTTKIIYIIIKFSTENRELLTWQVSELQPLHINTTSW